MAKRCQSKILKYFQVHLIFPKFQQLVSTIFPHSKPSNIQTVKAFELNAKISLLKVYSLFCLQNESNSIFFYDSLALHICSFAGLLAKIVFHNFFLQLLFSVLRTIQWIWWTIPTILIQFSKNFHILSKKIEIWLSSSKKVLRFLRAFAIFVTKIIIYHNGTDKATVCSNLYADFAFMALTIPGNCGNCWKILGKIRKIVLWIFFVGWICALYAVNLIKI